MKKCPSDRREFAVVHYRDRDKLTSATTLYDFFDLRGSILRRKVRYSGEEKRPPILFHHRHFDSIKPNEVLDHLYTKFPEKGRWRLVIGAIPYGEDAEEVRFAPYFYGRLAPLTEGEVRELVHPPAMKALWLAVEFANVSDQIHYALLLESNRIVA